MKRLKENRVRKSNNFSMRVLVTNWLTFLGYRVEQDVRGLRVRLENDSVFIVLHPFFQDYQISTENLPEIWVGGNIDEFKTDWNDLINCNRKKLNEAQLILKRHRTFNIKGYAARQKAKRRGYLKEIH